MGLACVNSVSLLQARLRNRIAKGLERSNFMPVTDWLTSAEAWAGAHVRETQYLAALGVVLGNPQSFRPEKISLLAEALSAMLDHEGPMPVAVRNEVEGDFCASAVHVAEEAGDLAGLDRVIALRREHLTEGAVQADPERAIQARMDIGRALLARAAKKYEPELVREAIGYLSQVVEALRADPSIMRAQAASDAMFKAQSLMETRKRFAVNFGT
jgi:hypothetical protein